VTSLGDTGALSLVQRSSAKAYILGMVTLGRRPVRRRSPLSWVASCPLSSQQHHIPPGDRCVRQDGQDLRLGGI